MSSTREEWRFAVLKTLGYGVAGTFGGLVQICTFDILASDRLR